MSLEFSLEVVISISPVYSALDGFFLKRICQSELRLLVWSNFDRLLYKSISCEFWRLSSLATANPLAVILFSRKVIMVIILYISLWSSLKYVMKFSALTLFDSNSYRGKSISTTALFSGNINLVINTEASALVRDVWGLKVLFSYPDTIPSASTPITALLYRAPTSFISDSWLLIFFTTSELITSLSIK